MTYVICWAYLLSYLQGFNISKNKRAYHLIKCHLRRRLISFHIVPQFNFLVNSHGLIFCAGFSPKHREIIVIH